MYALRGAIGVDADTVEAIEAASAEVVRVLFEDNDLRAENVVSAVFTSTPDLKAAYPATGARRALLSETPVLSACEVDVPGGAPQILRVLLHIDGARPAHVHHAFLGRGAMLRPDLESISGSDRP
ncbi:MAG: Chorismate mutase AroH [Pseudomonadota bacterium]